MGRTALDMAIDNRKVDAVRISIIIGVIITLFAIMYSFTDFLPYYDFGSFNNLN